MRLQGKTAIITGAGSGIGEASARIFAAEGAQVAVVDRERREGKKSLPRLVDRVFFSAPTSPTPPTWKP